MKTCLWDSDVCHVSAVMVLKLRLTSAVRAVALSYVSNFSPEWRAGVAGHLILSDEDLTSVVQGSWKRLNTLQHYKVSASHANTNMHTHTHQVFV